VRFVPGIELSIQEDRELHLLGYFPLGGHEALEPFLREQREMRRLRNREMVEALRALGIDVTQEEFEAEGEGVVGRLHAARILVRKHVVGSIREAFDRYLSFGRPGYVERPRPDAVAGCAAIRAAGGVPVLAHPALYGWLEDLKGNEGSDGRDKVPSCLLHRLEDLRDKGLAGVESAHGEAFGRQVKAIEATAHRLGMLTTRGSDFHGAGQNTVRTGMYAASTMKAWPDGTPKRKTLPVVAAIVLRTGPDGRRQVLLARRSGDRSQAGLWEFPGGKVHPAEPMETALMRELREELGVGSTVGALKVTLEHAYEMNTVRLSCFETELERTADFTLTAHSEVRWVPADGLADLPVCPADYPLADLLARQETSATE
jgi:mutator protein MutT